MNTYTYKGKRRSVNGWSVKIQLFGRRKSFSLASAEAGAAAAEACQIYQRLSAEGWQAIYRRAGKPRFQTALAPADYVRHAAAFDVAYWQSRLIHRKYPENSGSAGGEWAVRIEHLGISRYFPLGTSRETKAAAEAMKIYRCVVGQGWEVANRKFSRELSLALRWLDDPLAWTYTTIHTCKSGELTQVHSLEAAAPASARAVALVEPDTGLRHALAACIGGHEGFFCCGAYGSAAEALRELGRQRLDLVLVNYALPDRAGSVALEQLQQVKPGLAGVLYSEFEDSDQLFKNTPGGAAGYMLKRTAPHRIFEAIAEATGPLTVELVATKVRDYFQRLVGSMPTGPSPVATAKLTPREQEILALLAKGNLSKEIAGFLRISIWTVQGHVKSIFEKLGVHTRTEAVLKFLQK